MSKNKHLNLDDRCKIQLMLDNKESFSSIATALGKDPTTISKEIRNHLQYRRIGAIIFLTTTVPDVSPVRNPISAQNAMLAEGIPYAGAAPCAMLSVRISKKKPAGVS